MNTLKVKHAVLDNGIITLKADKTYSRTSGPINDLLVELGNLGKTLPFYAIYPADGRDPITFGQQPISQSTVLEKLKEAGPSGQLSKNADTAMRNAK